MPYTNRQYERAAHDWYVDPAWATEALLDNVHLDGTVWDPFCGRGTIPEVLKAHGLDVLASDICDRGYGMQSDFLKDNFQDDTSQPIDNIVCNPAYHKDEILNIIEKALNVARFKVCMLLPLTFLASQNRYKLFTQSPVASVLVMSARPSMPPGEVYEREIRKDPNYLPEGGKKDYIWLIWDKGKFGMTQIRWADPEKYSTAAVKKRRKKTKKLKEAA